MISHSKEYCQMERLKGNDYLTNIPPAGIIKENGGAYENREKRYFKPP